MTNNNIGNPDLEEVFNVQFFSPKNQKMDIKKYEEKVQMYKLDGYKDIKIGSIVNASYVKDNGDCYIFDMKNGKSCIFIDKKPSEEMFLENANIGDCYDILITDIDDRDYEVKGSISTIYENRAKDTLCKYSKDNTPLEVLVKELNPAGYKVEMNIDNVIVYGFMPNTLAGINKLYDPQSIIGKTIETYIESYSDNTFIVNRKRYLQSLIPSEIEKIKKIDRSTKLTGYITGTTSFGIFVEFNGCLTGMIHKANIAPEYVDVFNTFKPGYMIDFYIKEIIKNKIILTQINKTTLWDTIEIGQLLLGKVKDNKQFGTLVSLDDETLGLIHISDLEKNNTTLEIGQQIKVRVLSVERGNRKIFLGLEN